MLIGLVRTALFKARVWAPLLLAGLPTLVSGQEVVAPTSSSDRDVIDPGSPGGLHFMKLDIYPRANATALYDDNIFLNATVRESDLISILAPGAVLSLRDLNHGSLAISYSPNVLFFTDHNEYDAVEHFASATAGWGFSRLTLGLIQDYSQASSIVLGVPNRVTQCSLNTALSSSYSVSDKTLIEASVRQKLTDYAGGKFTGSREWVTDDWVNYRLAPKIDLAIGCTFGYLDVEQHDDQTYERVSIRGVYNPSDKLDLNVSAAGEHREYSATSSEATYPVFSLGAVYHPTALSLVSISSSRQESYSVYLADQNYVSTGCSASIQHVLLERFVISLTGSFYRVQYHEIYGYFSATQSYDSMSVRPGFGWLVNRNWRLGVYYTHRHNFSDMEPYDFSANQLGFHTTWSF